MNRRQLLQSIAGICTLGLPAVQTKPPGAIGAVRIKWTTEHETLLRAFKQQQIAIERFKRSLQEYDRRKREGLAGLFRKHGRTVEEFIAAKAEFRAEFVRSVEAS